jgi:hypothetical protein
VAGKYDELFYKDPITPGKFGDRLVYFARNHVGEKNYSLLWNYISEPFLMVQDPHTHEFDQFLHFFNADSANIAQFPAEIELTLGEELEKHIITEPTVIHVPAGMLHGPLEFKRVDGPVIFMNVAFTPEYMKPGEHPKP